MKKGTVSLSIVLMAVISMTAFARQPLTFEERVKAQEAIERVYYSHRIWPKENPQPKPAFEKMVTKEQIEAKVTDYLKKSAALDKFWQRPIVTSQLQAEMERMAKGTKDPATLNELFKALNDDPYLIAECLARPVLADRLIHNWYANDERFHGETKKKAEEALKTLTPENFCSYPEGQYSKVTYKLETQGQETEMEGADAEDSSIKLSEDEFAKVLTETPEERKISQVIEKDDCFVIVHTIEKNEGEIEIESLSFAKQSLDEWMKKQAGLQIAPEENNIKIYSLLPITDSACKGGWDNGILDDVPDPRCNHTAIWTGSEMIVWGGIAPSSTSYTGGRYAPATDTWAPTSTGTNLPIQRAWHTAVWTGSEMIIWGGEYYDNVTNTGARYNPVSDEWKATSTSTQVPLGRVEHTAVWTGTEMVIWGGHDGSTCLNSGGAYTPSTDKWRSLSTGRNVPSARYVHTAVWTGKEMIIWGGIDYDGFLTNSGGRYNPQKDTWIPTSTGINSPSARNGHSAIWSGSEMIIWGGEYNLNDGARYNPSSDTWIAVSSGASPSGMAFHTAIWTGREMIVWGNFGGKYNPTTDAWQEISMINEPSSRAAHSAVWTGEEMIVWGGLSGSDILNTGGRYNPSTDSWIPTSTVNAPAKRCWNTVVWTGSEMIVWGGNDQYTVFDTGGKYCLATDNWTPTSLTQSTPESRCEHSAIWTGAEMIVWGGSDYWQPSYQYLNSGAKYNPLTDSWSPTSTGSNCPSPRTWPNAIWTGEEMIIWGGSYSDGSGSYSLNTGGRYNPMTDKWRGISKGENVPEISGKTVWTGTEMIVWCACANGGRYNPSSDSWQTISTGPNKPNCRWGHTAIWTGKEMIVWGGSDYYGYVNTGGRYNPLTDSWLPTTTGENVPDGREYHCAVWTGSEMIIWGGLGYFYYIVGGKYDPVTDTWTPTSWPSCPQGRQEFTAVWAGDRMIIWGGYRDARPLSGYLNSGGIYFPSICTPDPTITSVSSATSPFRLKISGSNFQTGAAIKINDASVPSTIFKTSSLLVAKKGSELGAMAPKGTTVMITVVNPDGGVSEEFPFTR
jgi:hypothetical protein